MKIPFKLILIIFLFTGCKKVYYDTNVNSSCNVSNSLYSTYAGQIIKTNCAYDGCHGNVRDSGNKFNFTTYEGLKEAEGSLLDRLDRPVNDPLHMPPDYALNECDLQKLKTWIANGSPQN